MTIERYLRAAALALYLMPGLLFGQDLFSALGGVPAPQIRVTTDDGKVDLDATHQGFIRRAVSESDTNVDWGYGLGYESVHFTFATFERIDLLLGRLSATLEIKFYDENNVELYVRRTDRRLITAYCPQPLKGAPCSYEINMKGMLLTLINDVRRIDVDMK